MALSPYAELGPRPANLPEIIGVVTEETKYSIILPHAVPPNPAMDSKGVPKGTVVYRYIVPCLVIADRPVIQMQIANTQQVTIHTTEGL